MLKRSSLASCSHHISDLLVHCVLEVGYVESVLMHALFNR